MSGLAIKILVGLGTRLLTETFVARIVVHTLRAGAKRTEWDLDDKLVDDLAAGLGVDGK